MHSECRNASGHEGTQEGTGDPKWLTHVCAVTGNANTCQKAQAKASGLVKAQKNTVCTSGESKMGRANHQRRQHDLDS